MKRFRILMRLSMAVCLVASFALNASAQNSKYAERSVAAKKQTTVEKVQKFSSEAEKQAYMEANGLATSKNASKNEAISTAAQSNNTTDLAAKKQDLVKAIANLSDNDPIKAKLVKKLAAVEVKLNN